MIWWDHYAWRKNRKYVIGRLLLGKMNIKLLNKMVLSWDSKWLPTEVSGQFLLSKCLAKLW